MSLLVATIVNLIASSMVTASNFDISPTPGKVFPTTVNAGSSVSAFYTIKNNTHSTRSGYQVRGLPAAVTQNTSDPANCSNPINLPARGSCVLQLDISGEVKSGFALCKGSSCTSATVALNVSQASSEPLLPVVAAGNYNNAGVAAYPLIASSQDSGETWAYTLDKVSPALPADYDSMSWFNSVGCSEVVCVAAGYYYFDYTHGFGSPFVATSIDKGQSWTYTMTSFSAAVFPADYLNNGIVNSASCTGSNCIITGYYISNPSRYDAFGFTSTDSGQTWVSTINRTTPAVPVDYTGYGDVSYNSCSGQICIAGGSYNNNGNRYPLMATSQDKGLTWSYTITSASPALPPDYSSDARIVYTSCSGQNCIAVGRNTVAGQNFPLVASSNDGGLTWNYTINTTTPALPMGTTSAWLLNGNCSGARCVIAGYSNDAMDSYPLLAASTNGGASWTYVIKGTSLAFPPDYVSSGTFMSANCSGLNCIAVGSYNNPVQTFPLIATSNDGGSSWRYTLDSTTPTLPLGMTYGQLNYASCNGQSCVAMGQYNDGVHNYQLIVKSSDGGLSWRYTLDANSIPLPTGYIDNGYFNASSFVSN